MPDFLDINSRLEGYRNPPENYNFELGNTLFQSGEFKRSFPYLKQALNESLEKNNYDSYLQCYQILISICIEFCELDELQILYKDFEKNKTKFSTAQSIKSLTVYAYYLINKDICSGVEDESSSKEAFKVLTQALQSALDENALYVKTQDPIKDLEAKINIMNCLYMFSNYYYRQKDYEKCIKDLESLQTLTDYYFNLKEEIQLDKSKTDNFQEHKNSHKVLEVIQKNYQYIQRMKLHMKALEALIECEYKDDSSKSDKLLWECYELANKTHNIYFIPYILFYMSTNYAHLNDLKQAKVFLSLAERNADPNRKMFFNALEIFKKKTKIQDQGETSNYDIIFNEEEHCIVEKHKGCVNFKNQFILLDILKLFISNQGHIYSKKHLVEQVWKQEYSPSTHNNKIYVTIKRLRELLEVDINNPKYICRNSGGYYLHGKARILVK